MEPNRKVAVKICGIKSMDTLPVLLQEQPEYVGFVFAPSKRQVTPEMAAAIGKALSPAIQKVGVFMNEAESTLKEKAHKGNLDILQLHGQESPALCYHLRQQGYTVWKAFPLKVKEDLLRLSAYQVDGYLVDTAGAAGAGGTGAVFPWHWLEEVPDIQALPGPLILAGGLTPVNIHHALQQVSPDVVDVSSGVETNGVKDMDLIRKFIQKVRNDNVNECGKKKQTVL